MNNRNNYWWLGGLIGTIIGIIALSDEPGIGAFVGVTNGVFWGWIIGLIVNSIRNSSTVSKVSEKIKEKIEIRENLKETQLSINEYNNAKHRFQYLSNETLLEKLRAYSDSKEDIEKLALEEELVKRDMLSHSPMHEKMEKMRSYFKL